MKKPYSVPSFPMLLKSVPFWSAPSCPLKKPWSVPSFPAPLWSVPSFRPKKRGLSPVFLSPVFHSNRGQTTVFQSTNLSFQIHMKKPYSVPSFPMLLKSVPFWSAPSCPLKKPWSVPSFHSVVCPQFSEKPWSVPSFLEKTVVCPQFSQFSVPSFLSFLSPVFAVFKFLSFQKKPWSVPSFHGRCTLTALFLKLERIDIQRAAQLSILQTVQRGAPGT